MSNWVNVLGVVHIDTCFAMNEVKLQKIIERKLKSAPLITGSEENAEYIVHVDKGYNVSTWDDKTNDYIEYQSCATITIVGDLRDRIVSVTIQEVNLFLDFIYHTFPIVRNGVFRLTDDQNGTDIVCRDCSGLLDTLSTYERRKIGGNKNEC